MKSKCPDHWQMVCIQKINKNKILFNLKLSCIFRNGSRLPEYEKVMLNIGILCKIWMKRPMLNLRPSLEMFQLSPLNGSPTRGTKGAASMILPWYRSHNFHQVCFRHSCNAEIGSKLPDWKLLLKPFLSFSSGKNASNVPWGMDKILSMYVKQQNNTKSDFEFSHNKDIKNIHTLLFDLSDTAMTFKICKLVSSLKGSQTSLW